MKNGLVLKQTLSGSDVIANCAKACNLLMATLFHADQYAVLLHLQDCCILPAAYMLSDSRGRTTCVLITFKHYKQACLWPRLMTPKAAGSQLHKALACKEDIPGRPRRSSLNIWEFSVQSHGCCRGLVLYLPKHCRKRHISPCHNKRPKKRLFQHSHNAAPNIAK